MSEQKEMLITLNHLCKIVTQHTDNEYSVIDWVFGFIVFENEHRVFDGGYADVIKYLANKL